MAKKRDRQNEKTGPTVYKQPSPKKQSAYKDRDFISRFSHTTLIIAISFITWLFYKASLNNQFTDWDDKGYLLNNLLLKDLSFNGLKNIFVTPVMGHYHPITILIYALEYHLVQFDPWLYHFDSVLFHMFCVILSYWLVYLLTQNKTVSSITALLFSLHPMHVESVAWIAGRKDVLCTMFYFAACICYLYYLRTNDIKKKRPRYAGVFILYLLALLCKPIAVTLPLVLLLLDYYEKLNWKTSVFFEKIPFFITAVFFGLLSIEISRTGGVMDIHKVDYTFFERINLMGYTLFLYLWKALLPIHLHNFYPYPSKVNGSIPYYYFSFPLIIAAASFAFWYYFRHKKEIVFGMLFFMANIALLVKFIPVGDAIVAERYTYASYFGLFFIIGWLVSSFISKGNYQYPKYLVLIVCFFFMGYATSERCKVWYDARSLWTDEMVKEGAQAPVAYNNLGFYYFEKRTANATPAERKRDADSALYMLRKAVEFKPDYVNAIEGLGILYFMNHTTDSSLFYFRKFLELKPCSESYYDYALLLDNTNQRDSALLDYTQSIMLDSTNWKPRLNRGIIYQQQRDYERAIIDFDKAIKIDSTLGSAYYQRSICETVLGNRTRALEDVEKARRLGFAEIDSRFYNSLKNQ